MIIVKLNIKQTTNITWNNLKVSSAIIQAQHTGHGILLNSEMSIIGERIKDQFQSITNRSINILINIPKKKKKSN